MNKSLKQFIFEKMANDGYVMDKELAKFCGGEPDFSLAENYKEQYRRIEREKRNLENYKERFEEYEKHPDTLIEKYKNGSYKGAKTRFTLGNKTLLGENKFWKISKNYYEYLKENGIKSG
jgi:adenylate kinase family enzyme